jgi:hypothetical protein
MAIHERLHGVPVTRASRASRAEWRWRRRQLVAAGIDEVTACRLALRAGVDLHLVLSLIDQGCPPEAAASLVVAPSHDRP